MYIRFVLIGMLALMASCKKEKDNDGNKKSAVELLTQKEWILVAHGFDGNRNGIIDPVENNIEDCQEDNSYIFVPTGTGSSFDNAMSCGGLGRTDFAWKFLDNNTKLEIEFEQISILRLNENELMLSPDPASITVQYILVYRH